MKLNIVKKPKCERKDCRFMAGCSLEDLMHGNTPRFEDGASIFSDFDKPTGFIKCVMCKKEWNDIADNIGVLE